MKFLSTNKATLRGLVPTFLAAFILSCALFSRDLFAKSMLSFLSPSEDIGPVRTGDFVQIVQVKNETDPVSGKTVETKRYLVCMGVKQGDPGNNNGHLQFLTLREIIDYASSQTIPGGTISVPRNFGYESTWWMIHSPIPTNGASRSLTEHGKIIKSGDTVILSSLTGIGTSANCYLNLASNGIISWYSGVVDDNSFVISINNSVTDNTLTGGMDLSSNDGSSDNGKSFSLKSEKSPFYFASGPGTVSDALSIPESAKADLRCSFKIAQHFSMFALTNNFNIKDGKIQESSDQLAGSNQSPAHPNSKYASYLNNLTISTSPNISRVFSFSRVGSDSELYFFRSAQSLLTGYLDYKDTNVQCIIRPYNESSQVTKDRDWSRFISIKMGSSWLQFNNNSVVTFGGTRPDSWERWLLIPSPFYPGQGNFTLRSVQAYESQKPAALTYDQASERFICAAGDPLFFKWNFKEILSQNPVGASTRSMELHFGDVIQLSVNGKNLSSLSTRYISDGNVGDGTGKSFRSVGCDNSSQWWLIVPKDDSRWGSLLASNDEIMLYNLYSREYCFIDKNSKRILTGKSFNDGSVWKISLGTSQNQGKISLKSSKTKDYLTEKVDAAGATNIMGDSTELFLDISGLRFYENFITYGSVINLEYAERPGWTLATDQVSYSSAGSVLTNPKEMQAYCTTNPSEKASNGWMIQYAVGESTNTRVGWPVLLGDAVRLVFAGAKKDTTNTDSIYLYSRFGVPNSLTTAQQRIAAYQGDGLGCNWLVASPTGNSNKSVVAISSMNNDESSGTSPVTTGVWLIHQVTGQGLHAHHDDTHVFNNESTKRHITGYMTKQGDLGVWQMKKPTPAP